MAQKTMIDWMKQALESPKSTLLTLPQLISEAIMLFEKSPAYARMKEAETYYRNRSDVQTKTNEVARRTNTKIEHPILKKLVDQKANYLLSKQWTVTTDSEAYGKALNDLFNHSFRRKIKAHGRDTVKYGVTYLQPYFGADGKFHIMQLNPLQTIPLWEDAEKEILFAFIRFYEKDVYTGLTKKKIRCVEFWWSGGVRYYYTDEFGSVDGSVLTVDKDHGDESNDYTEPHFYVGKEAYNWERPPLFWTRYNDEELPLCYYVKDLIDDINWQTSVTSDVLRDVAKFVYVLKNYGGADLNEFIKDLKERLAIKVTDNGGVDKLEPELNIDAVMQFLDKQRKDLYDFANAVDTKDADLGNASGVAINFRYMDLDADCVALGAELQDTFLQMKPFLDCALQLASKGTFTEQDFSIVFNMDLPVNETDIINNAKNSKGLISDKTIKENHPWVDDVEEEERRMEEEAKKKMEEFGEGMFSDAFQAHGDGVAHGDEE